MDSLDSGDQTTAIKIADLVRVQKFWDEHCNLEEAFQMLGIRTEQVKGLLRKGVFSTVRFGSALRYVKRVEIQECLSDMDELPFTPLTFLMYGLSIAGIGYARAEPAKLMPARKEQ